LGDQAAAKFLDGFHYQVIGYLQTVDYSKRLL